MQWKPTRAKRRDEINYPSEGNETERFPQEDTHETTAVDCFLASEIERDLISKRTREAIQVKKQNGMKLGRPEGFGKSKLDNYRVEIETLLKNGST